MVGHNSRIPHRPRRRVHRPVYLVDIPDPRSDQSHQAAFLPGQQMLERLDVLLLQAVNPQGMGPKGVIHDHPVKMTVGQTRTRIINLVDHL
jgi:hypothetical protein